MPEGFKGEKHSVKKVSTQEVGYIEDQQTAADYSENKVFGSRILGDYHFVINKWNLPSALANDVKHKARAKRRIEERSKEISSEFKTFLSGNDARVRRAADTFIKNGLTYSADAEANVNKFLFPDKRSKKERSAPFDPEERLLVTIFDKGAAIPLSQRLEKRIREDRAIPANIWGAIIDGNEQAMRSLEEILQEKYLPAFVAAFRENAPQFLDQYGIAASTVQELFLRLDTLVTQVVDGLSANIESIGGEYVHHKNQVLIAAQYVSDKEQGAMEEIVNHEFFHALSGRLVRKEEDPTIVEDEMFGKGTYGEGRVGLHFGTPLWYLPSPTLVGKGRFHWLNEAVTERLTVELLEKQNHRIAKPSYNSEMKILEYLCMKGKDPIPFQTFVQAYFENYEPQSNKGEQTIPAWRTLREAINRSFDSKFLVALDERIKKVGSANVLKELESGTLK